MIFKNLILWKVISITVVKVVRIKDASTLSLTSLTIVDVGSVLWLMYAIFTNDKILIGWQIISCILNTTIIILKIKLDNRPVYNKLPTTELQALVKPNYIQVTEDAISTSFKYPTTEKSLSTRTSSIHLAQDYSV